MTNLKRIRESKGLSQSQLANAINMSKRTLQGFEQGRRDINLCAAIVVWKMARALGCEVIDILEEETT